MDYKVASIGKVIRLVAFVTLIKISLNGSCFNRKGSDDTSSGSASEKSSYEEESTSSQGEKALIGENGTPSKTSYGAKSTNFQKEKTLSDDGGLVEVRMGGAWKVEVRMHPPGSPCTVEQFFKRGDPNDFVKLVRKIRRIADKYGLNKWGFYLSAMFSDSCFTISSNYTSSDEGPKNTSIRLDINSPAEPAQEYSRYVKEGENYKEDGKIRRQVIESQYCVSFYSNTPPNRLVIPKKNSLTIYHYAEEGTEETIRDFYYHIRMLLNSKFSDQWNRFGVHTGSRHAQTVSHFHFRLEGR